MKKKILGVTLATLVTTSGLGNVPLLSSTEVYAATKETPEQKAESKVKSFETHTKALLDNMNKAVAGNLASIDKTKLSTAKTWLSWSTTEVKGLKTSSTKTKLENRIKTTKVTLDTVIKYNAAIEAGKRLYDARIEFNQWFNPDTLSSSIESLTTLQKVINREQAYFNAVGNLKAAFEKKHIAPAKSLISKYEREVNVSILLDDLGDDFYNEELNYVDLRKKIDQTKNAVDSLPTSALKKVLQDRLLDIVEQPEESELQSSITSPDTGLEVTLNGINITEDASSKKYKIIYTEANYMEDDKVPGHFKVYFANGTTKIFTANQSPISTFDKVTSSFEFTSTTAATYIEYGVQLPTNNKFSIGAIYWPVKQIESDVEEDPSSEDPGDEETPEEGYPGDGEGYPGDEEGYPGDGEGYPGDEEGYPVY